MFEHDARGNMVRRIYYDENGKPTRSKDNYAGLTKTYDASGNQVEEAYFNEAGEPTEQLRGYTKDERWSTTLAATRSRIGISARSRGRRCVPRTDMRG